LYRGSHVIVCKLQIMQPGVCSAFGKEFGVRPCFADLAFFEHQNFIGAPYGCEPVRYHKCGSSDHQVCERLLYEHFRFGIELRGSLVQN